jgi:hypothetical protein
LQFSIRWPSHGSSAYSGSRVPARGEQGTSIGEVVFTK